MTHQCPDCEALKFIGETSSTCCLNGKVELPAFPRPPPRLLELWTGSDSKSKLFRKNSRQINNAVCLSSIQVNEQRFGGFTPSVVFQGKLLHRAGSLIPADGERPRYVQLYVHDPALEHTRRFENLMLPTNMPQSHVAIMKDLLQVAQEEIHANNPYVQDFKQIMDIPAEEIADGMIVITAKEPYNEHARRYNQQVNLQEVSILTNSTPHDLVLHKRGGGLHTISDLNPKVEVFKSAVSRPLIGQLLPFSLSHWWKQKT